MMPNPLSLSQNNIENINSVIRDALRKLAIPDNQLMQIDLHSTIEIQLDNDLTLNISAVDDQVWLWSPVSMSDESFRNRAPEILSGLNPETLQHRPDQNPFLRAEAYNLSYIVQPQAGY